MNWCAEVTPSPQIINKLFTELTLFLFPRYKIDFNKFILQYDPNSVPALQEAIRRRNNEIRDDLDPNERRALINRGPKPGGDVLYQDSSLVPLGSTPLIPQIPPSTSKEKQEKLKNMLKDQVLESGEPVYSDKFIKKV